MIRKMALFRTYVIINQQFSGAKELSLGATQRFPSGNLRQPLSMFCHPAKIPEPDSYRIPRRGGKGSTPGKPLVSP